MSVHVCHFIDWSTASLGVSVVAVGVCRDCNATVQTETWQEETADGAPAPQ